MAVWRRHGEKIYLDNKAFATIVPGLTIGEEREFDGLVTDASHNSSEFGVLFSRLDEAASTEQVAEQMARELAELADGWQRLTVDQITAYLGAFKWPEFIQPNSTEYEFSKIS